MAAGPELLPGGCFGGLCQLVRRGYIGAYFSLTRGGIITVAALMHMVYSSWGKGAGAVGWYVGHRRQSLTDELPDGVPWEALTGADFPLKE